MTERTTTRLAWSLGSFSLAAYVGALTLGLLGPSGLPLVDPSQSAALDYAGFLLSAVVGTLVAWKRPANAVGWLILAFASAGGVQTFSGEYAMRGLVFEPGSLPGAGLAAWIAAWIWSVYIALIPLILLHFPNGRLPSLGWRWVRRCSAVPPGLLLAAVAVISIRVPARVMLLNQDEYVPGFEWVSPVFLAALGMFLALGLASVVSLFVRYRRARHEERQQLKWVIVAAAILIASGTWDTFLPGPEPLKLFVSAIGFAAVPASIGIAILKYRLYDIDRIISRTIVYALVTALLACIYFVLVLIPPWLGRGRGDEPPFVVAASTLLIVALFRPVRRRVQATVDRRFYRSRYDAGRLIDAFGARLREETDLDELTGDLVGVVRTTMQPEHVSLWLRTRETGP
jgi:hypothetical protein